MRELQLNFHYWSPFYDDYFFWSWQKVHIFALSLTSLRPSLLTPQWQWPLKRIPTAKITSWQWPVNQWLTNSINKNPSLAVTGHQIWCICIFMLNLATLKNHQVTFHTPTSPVWSPLYNDHSSLTAKWPLYRGSTVLIDDFFSQTIRQLHWTTFNACL